MGLYLPLDANYGDDDAILGLDIEGELLFIRALCLAKRRMSDGFIGRHQLRRLCDGMTGNPDDIAAALVHVGLWSATETGWMIRSWAKHNLLTGDLEAKRAADTHRKTIWRQSRDAAATSRATNRDKSRDAPRQNVTTQERERVKRRESEEKRGFSLEPAPKTEIVPAASTQPTTSTARPRAPLFDALAIHAEGIPVESLSTLTTGQARAIAVAAAEIAKAGGKPDMVPAAAASYSLQFPGATITANALAKHWGRCGPGAGTIPNPARPGSSAASRQRASFDRIEARLNAELNGTHPAIGTPT